MYNRLLKILHNTGAVTHADPRAGRPSARPPATQAQPPAPAVTDPQAQARLRRALAVLDALAPHGSDHFRHTITFLCGHAGLLTLMAVACHLLGQAARRDACLEAMSVYAAWCLCEGDRPPFELLYGCDMRTPHAIRRHSVVAWAARWLTPQSVRACLSTAHFVGCGCAWQACGVLVLRPLRRALHAWRHGDAEDVRPHRRYDSGSRSSQGAGRVPSDVQLAPHTVRRLPRGAPPPQTVRLVAALVWGLCWD